MVAVASDFRNASSRAMGGVVGLIHRLDERGFRYTRNGDLCAYVNLRALARPEDQKD